MFDMPDHFATLRRPRLLMRTARIGLTDYRRNRDLRRILPEGGGGAVLICLLDIEARHETDRVAGLVTYSPLRHVEVLIALLAEWHLMRPAQDQRSPATE